MSYSRYFDPAQVESDQKDLIISQLKADVFELRQNERDYQEMSTNLNNLEHRYSMLQEEKERIERDYKVKNDNNNRQISALKGELEGLRADLANENILIQELKTDNHELSDIAEKREVEISRFKNEYEDAIERKRKLISDRKSLESQVFKLREEKRKLLEELERTREALSNIIGKTKALEKEIHQLDAEYEEMAKLQSSLQRENDRLNIEVKKKGDLIRELERSLEDNNKVLQSLESEIKNLEKIIEKNKQESVQSNKSYQLEQMRNKELMEKCSLTEGSIRNKDAHIADLKREYDKLKKSNYEITEDNRGLEEEIEHYLSIVAELSTINQELCEEIEKFAEGDERAINLLNRRDRMMAVISKTENKIKQSLLSIQHLTSSGNRK